MTSNKINHIKNRALDFLPRPLAIFIYSMRHREVTVNTKIFENDFLQMAVPFRSRNSLFYENELGVRLWLKKHLRPDDADTDGRHPDKCRQDIFFDVGCCFGYYPAVITHLHPRIEIYAFEPTWRHTLFIKSNSRMHENPGKPWIIVEKFAGEKNNRTTLRLDDYCIEKKITPSIIKMDIDGGEYSALRGATLLIAQRKTEFLLELHPRILAQSNIGINDIFALFPGYKINVLQQVRTGNAEWSNDIADIKDDENPYAYLAPPEIARF